jgi:hypothetical protein
VDLEGHRTSGGTAAGSIAVSLLSGVLEWVATAGILEAEAVEGIVDSRLGRNRLVAPAVEAHTGR